MALSIIKTKLDIIPRTACQHQLRQQVASEIINVVQDDMHRPVWAQTESTNLSVCNQVIDEMREMRRR